MPTNDCVEARKRILKRMAEACTASNPYEVLWSAVLARSIRDLGRRYRSRSDRAFQVARESRDARRFIESEDFEAIAAIAGFDGADLRRWIRDEGLLT